MFIDDLMEEIKGAQAGVECGGDMVSGLLYADDAVVIAPWQMNAGYKSLLM